MPVGTCARGWPAISGRDRALAHRVSAFCATAKAPNWIFHDPLGAWATRCDGVFAATLTGGDTSAGEAVGWGMIAALHLARQRGTISASQFARLEKAIHLYGPLPPLNLRLEKVVAATGGDKKNVGGVKRFVLPVGIGDAGVVEDVAPSELDAAVRYMLAHAGATRA